MEALPCFRKYVIRIKPVPDDGDAPAGVVSKLVETTPHEVRRDDVVSQKSFFHSAVSEIL